MLLRELLKVFPITQKCKIIYYEDEEIYEVKGTPTYLLNNYEYLLEHEVITAYSKTNNSFINICL